MGSSEAAFCGLLQGRRDDACRWARLRRLSAGFCRATETMLPVGLVRGGLLRAFPRSLRGSSEAGFPRGIFQRRRCAQCRRTLLPFFPPPPGERMPRARSRPCEPAGSPYPFPQFPARPSHTSSFTLPPGQRYRARSPRRCFPMVSSKAAFCGLLQGRRGDASRWARPRRLPTGFSNGGTARSAAVPFCPSFPAAQATEGARSLFALSAARPALHLFLLYPAGRTADAARGRRSDAR